MTRAEYMRQQQRERYAWAKSVDPQAVAAFERKANEQRAK